MKEKKKEKKERVKEGKKEKKKRKKEKERKKKRKKRKERKEKKEKKQRKKEKEKEKEKERKRKKERKEKKNNGEKIPHRKLEGGRRKTASQEGKFGPATEDISSSHHKHVDVFSSDEQECGEEGNMKGTCSQAVHPDGQPSIPVKVPRHPGKDSEGQRSKTRKFVVIGGDVGVCVMMAAQSGSVVSELISRDLGETPNPRVSFYPLALPAPRVSCSTGQRRNEVFTSCDKAPKWDV
ncbi:hypothetical protein C0Q70_17679 [Pomacea canaliculata]|uniref:Uncharacterized protein n=1 Tax=Pomacea canaliculata TaxID=400727 RepID=A0A2T7NL42_POMCA|nr:hypothetical protein C0Q70_17679 [Pomacea canaliculata]